VALKLSITLKSQKSLRAAQYVLAGRVFETPALKIQEDLQFRLKRNWKSLGFGFFMGDVIIGAGLRILVNVIGSWASNQRAKFLIQVFIGN